MTISTERGEQLAGHSRILTPGRIAGRTVDGFDLLIDGVPSGRMPPRWVEQLESLGYNPASDGPVTFELMVDQQPETVVGDIREALYEGLATIAAGRHPDGVRLDAITSVGHRVEVVSGHPLIGMAIGALEDEPILVIEGPSVLPCDPPSEQPAIRDLPPPASPGCSA